MMKTFLTIIILLVVGTLSFGQTQYYVNPSGTDDGAHGNGAGTSAWKTIQYAILNVANPTTATIVINVAAGTYTEAGVLIDKGFTNLSIVGANTTIGQANVTIVQAHATAGSASDRVFEIIGSDETITFSNLTIRHGKSAGGSDGGGIRNDGGTLSTNNCEIMDNITDGSGGGIYTQFGTLNITNSSISGNSALATSLGGGITCWDASLSLSNCTISNNTGGYGGGLCFYSTVATSSTITNCTISNNNAGVSVPGIYYDQVGTASLTITNSILANNDTEDLHVFTGTITNGGNNIVENWANNSGETSTFINGVNGCFVGAGDYGVNTTLALNSTLNGTRTLSVTSGSDAVNNANVAQAPTNDQRGATRSGTPDIGAYEFGGVTPVELTTFTAGLRLRSASEQDVVLNWTTATEVNNYGFEIERQNQVSSIKNQDKNQIWETIAFVEGHGNSNSPKEYSFVDVEAPSGKISYRLKQIDIDGAFEYSDVVTVELATPENYSLKQNYPNPFNPTTMINFALPQKVNVSLKVFNSIGEEVAELLNKEMNVGSHSVIFDATNLSSGIYFYRISAGSFTRTNKMLLIR